MMNCHACNAVFHEEDAIEKEIDGCVGCGMSPCLHCTDRYYICPACGSDDTDELNIDGKYYIRQLVITPPDKVFDVSGNEELCRATGFEVCELCYDPTDNANWWNEYEDSEGNYHYGRQI